MRYPCPACTSTASNPDSRARCTGFLKVLYNTVNIINFHCTGNVVHRSLNVKRVRQGDIRQQNVWTYSRSGLSESSRLHPPCEQHQSVSSDPNSFVPLAKAGVERIIRLTYCGISYSCHSIPRQQRQRGSSEDHPKHISRAHSPQKPQRVWFLLRSSTGPSLKRGKRIDSEEFIITTDKDFAPNIGI